MGHAKDIWAHSSRAGSQQYVILAVDQVAAFKGFLVDMKIGWKPLKGMYNGRVEDSFIINADYLHTVMTHGWLAGQESVMVLGITDSRDRRPAHLMYLSDDGDMSHGKANKPLGVLQSVSREEAQAQDNYTLDLTTGEYYITVDPNKIDLDRHGLEAAQAVLGPEFAHVERIIRAYLKNRRTI
jgi:hypothetical protein